MLCLGLKEAHFYCRYMYCGRPVAVLFVWRASSHQQSTLQGRHAAGRLQTVWSACAFLGLSCDLRNWVLRHSLLASRPRVAVLTSSLCVIRRLLPENRASRSHRCLHEAVIFSCLAPRRVQCRQRAFSLISPTLQLQAFVWARSHETRQAWVCRCATVVQAPRSSFAPNAVLYIDFP